MELYPAFVVHGLGEAVAVLAKAAAEGGGLRPGGVTLLSAPGAALYAGCGWWRAVVEQAQAAYPAVSCLDILDCADATGQALAALRIGVSRLVLWPEAPGRDSVVAIAEAQGGFVLAAAPVASDATIIARANRGMTSTTGGAAAGVDHLGAAGVTNRRATQPDHGDAAGPDHGGAAQPDHGGAAQPDHGGAARVAPPAATDVARRPEIHAASDPEPGNGDKRRAPG